MEPVLKEYQPAIHYMAYEYTPNTASAGQRCQHHSIVPRELPQLQKMMCRTITLKDFSLCSLTRIN